MNKIIILIIYFYDIEQGKYHLHIQYIIYRCM